MVDRSGNIVGEPIVGAITEKKQAETLQSSSTRLLPPIWADKRIYLLRKEGYTMYRRVLPLLLTAVLLLSGFHKAH